MTQNCAFSVYYSFLRTVTFSQQQVALGKAPRSGVRCVSLPNSKIEYFLHPLRRSLGNKKCQLCNKCTHRSKFTSSNLANTGKFQMRILSRTEEGNYEQRLIGKSAGLAVFSGQFMNDWPSASTSNLFCCIYEPSMSEKLMQGKLEYSKEWWNWWGGHPRWSKLWITELRGESPTALRGFA